MWLEIFYFFSWRCGKQLMRQISEVKDCGAGPNKRNKLKLDATSHVSCSPVPNLNPNDSITKLNKSITIFGG
jgi:hypothetical protein